MKFFSLKGGIHPDENKYAIADRIIKPDIQEGDEFFISFSQHIGAPAKSVVKKGQEVIAGELIAEASADFSVSVHSPIDGIVSSLGKVPHPIHGSAEGCIIKAVHQSGRYKPFEEQGDFLKNIRAAGLVGLGGAGFPTHIKVSSGIKADTLLINASECEPYITCDYSLMLNYPEEILKGAKLLKDFINAEYVVIAVESNKKDAAVLLEKLSHSYGVEIVIVSAVYPQGSEKQLIKTVLSRTIPQGKFPADVGVLIQNIATIKTIYDAQINHKPLFERIVTVSGIVDNPCNIMAPIGMTAEMVFRNTGNCYNPSNRLIFGGPMTGAAVTGSDIPIIKTTGCILQLAGNADEKEHNPCIRCGRCVKACVMGLVPTELEHYYEVGDIKKMIDLNVSSCIECGCCSYVCPSGRLLSQSIKSGKRRASALLARKNR